MIPLDICLVDLFAGGLISLAAMSIPLGEVISCNLGSKGCWYKKNTAAVRTAKVKGKRYHLDIALEIWKYYMISSLHYVLASFYHTTLPGQLKTIHHWWTLLALPPRHPQFWIFILQPEIFSASVDQDPKFLSMCGKYKTFQLILTQFKNPGPKYWSPGDVWWPECAVLVEIEMRPECTVNLVEQGWGDVL